MNFYWPLINENILTVPIIMVFCISDFCESSWSSFDQRVLILDMFSTFEQHPILLYFWSQSQQNIKYRGGEHFKGLRGNIDHIYMSC